VKRVLRLAAHYIGGWTKDGLYYLDISIPVEGYEQAMKVARQNRQETIYHPATDTVYRVEPEASPVVAQTCCSGKCVGCLQCRTQE
jgi:hypothetical protein